MKSDEFMDSKMHNAGNSYPSTNAQEGLNIVTKCILGEDWFCVDPIHNEQVNTVAVYEILKKLEKNRQNIFVKMFNFLKRL